MCNSNKNQSVKDELIHELEKTLFDFYKQHVMTDNEIARLIKIETQAVIEARYDD